MDAPTLSTAARARRANFTILFEGLALDFRIEDDGDFIDIDLLNPGTLDEEEIDDAIAQAEREWIAANE